METPIKTTIAIQTAIMLLTHEHGESDSVQLGEIEIALDPVRVAIISEIENEKVSTFLGDSGLLYGVRLAEYLTGEDQFLHPADKYGHKYRHSMKAREVIHVGTSQLIEALYEMLYRVFY